MKNRLISIVLVLAMVLSLGVSVYGVELEHTNSKGEVIELNDFLDTKGHWAHDNILKWAEYDLIVGSNGYFMPNNYIKRGDLAIILDRMLGLKTISYNFFNDLPNNSYYRDSVLRCVAAGYIAGTSSNTVSPEGYATREQVAVIICRMFDIDTSYMGYSGFVDDNLIGDWARPSVSAMKRLGYMNGTNEGQVNPKSYITRAEMITILSNIANTYIPKKDITNEGSSFKSNFSTNVVVSRNIDLIDSVVGRDLIMTQSASSLLLSDSQVKGRLYVMGKANIDVKNSKVTQIYLNDGKSSISGISNDIAEVYVSKDASESSMDAIPKKLVLESGVRVKVDSIMYENDSTKTKTYYGNELKAEIADEQGYVIGGPKVRGVKFTQGQDNAVSVSNIQITVGDSKIKEVGVIWLDQEDDIDPVNPTCKNYDGKKVYKSDRIGEPFGFDVGSVKGTRAYRVYVIDNEGLFAYSDSVVFSEYEFSTSLKIYDNDYPEKVDVEVVFKGDSIPSISSVRVVYDIDELYSEKHNEIGLRKYYDADAEVQPDENKYQRYVGTISCDYERVDDEYVYNPPTAFGYIITFKDGSIINRFPVLTGAVPAGVSPMSALVTGSGSLLDSKISIKSRITTRYVLPQEVGIVYKFSNEKSLSNPSVSSWNKATSYVNVGLNDTAYFNNTIIPNTDYENTFYAAYVKTSNGYWYGDVRKMSNDFMGHENGYKLVGARLDVVGDKDAVVSVQVEGAVPDLDDIVSLGDDLGVATLRDLDAKISGKMVYFVLKNLNADISEIPLRINNKNAEKSNLITLSVNLNSKLDLSLKNKQEKNGYYSYSLSCGDGNEKIKIVDAELVGSSTAIYKDGDLGILVPTSVPVGNSKVKVEFTYYVLRTATNTIEWRFVRTFDLY